MRTRMGCVLALLFASCAALHAAEMDVTVLTVEGAEQKGKLVGLTGAALKLGDKNIPLNEVSEIRFAEEDKPAPSPASLYFRGGDLLKNIEIEAGTDTKLKFKSKTLGAVELENKYVEALVFNPKTAPPVEALEAFLKAPAPKEDLLFTARGETITGFFEKLSDKELTFNAGNQSRGYAFEQISAIRLAPLDPLALNKELRGVVRLKDGSRLTGKLEGLEGDKLKLQVVQGANWTVAADTLRSITLRGGKLVYLTSLTPKQVEEKPYVGGVPFVYRWRKDRSASNGKLQIGSTSYEHGLGTHSYCRLVYDLEGQYAKFQTEIGVDAAAAPGAVCAWKVRIDGKDVEKGTQKRDGEKVAIDLNIQGARTLELICDYGPDDDDAGDHLNWVNARLIKP